MFVWFETQNCKEYQQVNNTITEDSDLGNPITSEELCPILSSLKKRKAARVDVIYPEMLVPLGEKVSSDWYR